MEWGNGTSGCPERRLSDVYFNLINHYAPSSISSLRYLQTVGNTLFRSNRYNFVPKAAGSQYLRRYQKATTLDRNSLRYREMYSDIFTDIYGYGFTEYSSIEAIPESDAAVFAAYYSPFDPIPPSHNLTADLTDAGW